MSSEPQPDPFAFVRQVQATFPGAVMSRLVLQLDTARNREIAKRAIDKAPPGYVADIHEEKRSDEQNRALWPRLAEIQKQRPMHNSVPMSPELWKAVFMDALGHETAYAPKLEGAGYFPIGHRSSLLSKTEFGDLLSLIDAWAAQNGIHLKHFDDPQEQSRSNAAPRKVA
jgi:hypothetical protein